PAALRKQESAWVVGPKGDGKGERRARSEIASGTAAIIDAAVSREPQPRPAHAIRDARRMNKLARAPVLAQIVDGITSAFKIVKKHQTWHLQYLGRIAGWHGCRALAVRRVRLRRAIVLGGHRWAVLPLVAVRVKQDPAAGWVHVTHLRKGNVISE